MWQSPCQKAPLMKVGHSNGTSRHCAATARLKTHDLYHLEFGCGWYGRLVAYTPKPKRQRRVSNWNCGFKFELVMLGVRLSPWLRQAVKRMCCNWRSGRTDSLKGPRNGNPTSDLQMAADRTRLYSLRGPLGTCDTRCHCETSKSC